MKGKDCKKRNKKRMIAVLVVFGVCLLTFLFDAPKTIFAAATDNGLTDQGGNELSFYFSTKDGGSLTSTLQVLIHCTVNFDYGDFVYPHPDCPPFYQDGTRNADNAAKSSFNWTGIVSHGIYYVASLFKNQY